MSLRKELEREIRALFNAGQPAIGIWTGRSSLQYKKLQQHRKKVKKLLDQVERTENALRQPT